MSTLGADQFWPTREMVEDHVREYRANFGREPNVPASQMYSTPEELAEIRKDGWYWVKIKPEFRKYAIEENGWAIMYWEMGKNILRYESRWILCGSWTSCDLGRDSDNSYRSDALERIGQMLSAPKEEA